MLDAIAENSRDIGGYQLSLLDDLAADLFRLVIGVSIEDFGKANFFQSAGFEEAMKAALNTAWSGENYSKRIWRNTNALAG